MKGMAMTDLEMTKLCAEAMGIALRWPNLPFWPSYFDVTRGMGGEHVRYDPLHDDAQAMALVKKFRLEISVEMNGEWQIYRQGDFGPIAEDATHHDLNRAIVECVAKMRLAQLKADGENPPEAWYEHGDPNKDDDPGHVNE